MTPAKPSRYAPGVPVYLVRWANISASLVQADDEDHLATLLDEVGDPGAAIWEEYDGPLWIEFGPKRHLTEPYAIVDDFDTETGPADFLRAGPACGDTSYEMYATILERLFPHLHVALEQTLGSDLSDEQAKAIVKRALEREDWHSASIDERAQRYAEDPNLLGAIGATVLTKGMASAMLHGLEQARKAGRDVDATIMAMAAQQRDDIAWREAQRERLEAERRRAMKLADEELDN